MGARIRRCAALAASILLASGLARASIYTEAGDAGDLAAPQDVVGSGVTQIDGDLIPVDPMDVYRFFFAGGDLGLVGTMFVTGPNPGDPVLLVPLPMALYLIPPDPMVPVFATIGALGFENLAAANYLLQVCTPNDPICPASDPPYTVGFFTLNADGSPNVNAAAQVSAPIPAPATLALLVAAAFAAFASRRPGSMHRRPPH